jgi:hypothetical protein
VLVRELRPQAGDDIARVARGELLRDEQVDAVRPARDPLVDPGELGVELRGGVGGGGEHAEAAGLGDLGDDRG